MLDCPSNASLSILGPPGYPSPNTLATFSKDYPLASSLVFPSTSNVL